MITGFEILPFHIVYVVSFILFFYGYFKKSILITNLAAISLVLVGLFGIVNGIPYVSGYTETVAGGITTITKTIGYERDIATDMGMMVSMLVGVGSMIILNFKLWEEREI